MTYELVLMLVDIPQCDFVSYVVGIPIYMMDPLRGFHLPYCKKRNISAVCMYFYKHLWVFPHLFLV